MFISNSAYLKLYHFFTVKKDLFSFLVCHANLVQTQKLIQNLRKSIAENEIDTMLLFSTAVNFVNAVGEISVRPKVRHNGKKVRL